MYLYNKISITVMIVWPIAINATPLISVSEFEKISHIKMKI